jgi:predicted esterase YcpF (UPF0227 family)
MDNKRLIYLHGSESDSNSGKARLFREWFPGMLTQISLAPLTNAWRNFAQFSQIKTIRL